MVRRDDHHQQVQYYTSLTDVSITKTFLWQDEVDCDDLPPPPGHPDEGLGQGCQSSQRLLVSPRPIKNPVHEIQQVLLELNLSESLQDLSSTTFIRTELRVGIFSSLIQLVTLLTLDYQGVYGALYSFYFFKVIGKNVDTFLL